MRYDDEEDFKKPQPISRRTKGENPAEAEEHHLRKVGPDDRLDRHHHVHRC